MNQPCLYSNGENQWAVRVPNAKGAVWFLLNGDPRGDMNVSIWDECLMHAMRNDNGIIKNDQSEHDKNARNKYGTGAVLRACRAVMSCFPSVTNWVYERISGATVGGERSVTNG